MRRTATRNPLKIRLNVGGIRTHGTVTNTTVFETAAHPFLPFSAIPGASSSLPSSRVSSVGLTRDECVSPSFVLVIGCVCEILNHHCNLCRSFYCPWHLAVDTISNLPDGWHITGQSLLDQGLCDRAKRLEVIAGSFDVSRPATACCPLSATGLIGSPRAVISR